MTNRTGAGTAARFILVLSALFLPTLSLVPLGGLYLWQNGYLLWWALAALAVVCSVHLAQRWLLRPLPSYDEGSAVPDATPTPSDRLWNPAEEKAWADVKLIAARVDLDKLGDLQAVLDLGHATVNAVARRLHPEKADAVWRFTLPEALAITEQVSRRLGGFVEQNIPFGDRLTVSQAIQIYRWRHVAGVAERAYDVWRLLRLANPATAATHEARERLSRTLLQWGREHVARRLAENFVEEVGRAAIDLYGGRLKIARGQPTPGALDASGSLDDGAAGEAKTLDVLVVGGEATSRSAVVSLIEAAWWTHGIAAATSPAEPASEEILADTLLSVQDSKADPACGKPARSLKTLSGEVAEADIVVWLLDQERRPAEWNGAALTAITSYFAARPALLPPPIVPLIIVAHPEDMDPGRGPGPQIATWLHDLATLHVAYALPQCEPVTIALQQEQAKRNAAKLWQSLMGTLPHARRVRHLRETGAVGRRRNWFGAVRQAASAVGSLAKSAFSRRSRRR